MAEDEGPLGVVLAKWKGLLAERELGAGTWTSEDLRKLVFAAQLAVLRDAAKVMCTECSRGTAGRDRGGQWSHHIPFTAYITTGRWKSCCAGPIHSMIRAIEEVSGG